MAAGKKKSAKSNTQSIPTWAARRIDAEGIDAIATAIHNFESRVAGEILPMLVRSSTSVAFARGYWFFIFCTFILLANTYFAWGWEILSFLVAFSGVCAWFSSRSLRLSQMLVPMRDQDFETHEAAELEFYRFHINQTSDHGGILIYLSWIERRAVILVDPALDGRVDPKLWKRAMVLMQTQLREKKHVTAAFIGVIEFLTEHLGQAIPRAAKGKATTKNELSNRLIIR